MHRLSHQNLKCGVIAVVHAKITGNGEVFNFIKGNYKLERTVKQCENCRHAKIVLTGNSCVTVFAENTRIGKRR
jgi:hypothetical protein